MRKLDLTNYDVVEQDSDGKNHILPYRLTDSLVALLFTPALKLTAREVIEQNKLPEKIIAAKDFILLEEDEYNKLVKAVEAFAGYRKADTELVRRVLEAEKVDVVEK